MKNIYSLSTVSDSTELDKALFLKRNYLLTPSLIGKKLSLYNGKSFTSFEMKSKMVNFFSGAYSWSKIFGKRVQIKWLAKKALKGKKKQKKK